MVGCRMWRNFHQLSFNCRRMMSVFDTHYFRINKFCLSCMGLWPYLSSRRKWFMRTLVTIIIILYFIPLVIGLYEVWGNIDLMVECIINIVTSLGCLACSFTYIIKEAQLKTLFNSIENDWAFFSSEGDTIILERHADSGRILTLIYTGCMVLACCNYILTNFAPQILDIILPLNQTRPRKLPSQMEYFVNWEDYIYWIELHIAIVMSSQVLIVAGCRTTFSVLTEHACGLFSNVGYRLNRIMKNINLDKMNSNLEDIIYKDVTFCIEHHKQAIEFTKIIESCFSSWFFFIMGITILLLSTTLIMTVLNINQIDDASKFGVYSVGVMLDLYFNNLTAQRLIDHSSSYLSESIFGGMWYQLPLKSRKLLVMIILRTNVPCALTAGKIFLMNMDNFAKVLKSSLSYFTLLSSIRS